MGQEGSGGRDEKWAGLRRLPCPLPSPPPLSSGRGAAARSGPAAWSGPRPVLSASRSPSIATSAWGSLRAAPFSPSAYAFPPPSAATNLTRLISYTNELRTRETTVPSIADAAVRNGWAGLSRGWEEAALCSFSLPLFFSSFFLHLHYFSQRHLRSPMFSLSLHNFFLPALQFPSLSSFVLSYSPSVSPFSLIFLHLHSCPFVFPLPCSFPLLSLVFLFSHFLSSPSLSPNLSNLTCLIFLPCTPFTSVSLFLTLLALISFHFPFTNLHLSSFSVPPVFFPFLSPVYLHFPSLSPIFS